MFSRFLFDCNILKDSKVRYLLCACDKFCLLFMEMDYNEEAVYHLLILSVSSGSLRIGWKAKAENYQTT